MLYSTVPPDSIFCTAQPLPCGSDATMARKAPHSDHDSFFRLSSKVKNSYE